MKWSEIQILLYYNQANIELDWGKYLYTDNTNNSSNSYDKIIT